MKNTVLIHNSKNFNKEHDFRKNGVNSNINTTKSKDNVYLERNAISDKDNTYQFIISFPEGVNEKAVMKTLVEYLETSQERLSFIRVNYGAIHCDELNSLSHLHLTYTKIDEIPDDFLEKEKAYLNSLYKKKGMQIIKDYITTNF